MAKKKAGEIEDKQAQMEPHNQTLGTVTKVDKRNETIPLKVDFVAAIYDGE